MNPQIARLTAVFNELMRRLRTSSGLPATGAPTLTGPSFDPIKARPWVYFLGLFLLASAYYAAGLVSSKTVGFFGSQVPMFWALGMVHFVTGLRVVDRDTIAGVLFLGIPTIEVTGHVVLVPIGIFKMPNYQLGPIDIRVPTDPAKVWGGGRTSEWPKDNNGVPFEEPIRVPFAGREHKDIQPLMAADGTTVLRTAEDIKKLIHKDDPLLMRGTQEISFYVRLVIKSRSARDEWGFFDFYVRVRTYENARDQVKELGIAKLFEEFGKVSMAEVQANLELYNSLFQAHLDKLVASWGVDVPTAKVSIQFTKTMNEAILGIPKAKATAQAAVMTAEGAKTATILAGEGAKQVTILDAEGQKEKMTKLGINGKLAVAAEVAQSIAKGTNEKIVLLGADSLVGSVASIAKGLAKLGA
jgi:hypothetical protein